MLTKKNMLSKSDTTTNIHFMNIISDVHTSSTLSHSLSLAVFSTIVRFSITSTVLVYIVLLSSIPVSTKSTYATLSKIPSIHSVPSGVLIKCCSINAFFFATYPGDIALPLVIMLFPSTNFNNASLPSEHI